MINYPELCAVWDDNKHEKEVYFDIIVGELRHCIKGKSMFEGMNGATWKYAEPVRDKDPMTFLCNNKLYEDITEPKIEDDFFLRDALFIDQIDEQWIVHGNVDGYDVKMEASSFDDAIEKAYLYFFKGEEQ